jgi:hypothetical protein
MIYMVEQIFNNAERETEWNAWYMGHLWVLLSVPGIDTAQRLRQVGTPSSYLAIYSVASPEVYDSEAYANVGGGGHASVKWKDYVRRRRVLFDGLGRVPEIGPNHCLIISEPEPASLDLPNLLFLPLHRVLLDSIVQQRFLAIAQVEQVERDGLIKEPALRIYEPITERRVANRMSASGDVLIS